ncbi:hypothetical protein QWY28_16530 [Nocardioides sp. SOB77]|uniref:O-antigen ligase-related domain-containing protein n=1 Tax=Nocardioides oceani TaxID=3058369 RepID=A0ABT8FIY7_9ACTN|nr:O-antigen ligase family protein [Nocardioides oceani]MDN4174569.1 hypothetical protein [Nocardioides oceani]
MLRVGPQRAASLLAVLLWLRLVGELLVLSFTTEKRFVPVGQEAPSNATAGAVATGLTVATIAVAGLLVLANLNAATRVGLGRVGLFLLPWLYLLCRDAYAGHVERNAVVFALIVLALAALNPGVALFRTLAALTVLTAVIALVLGIVAPETALLRETTGELRISDKALVPALGLLQGPFTSENNLAQYLALGLPSLVVLRRRAWRWTSVVLVLLAIGWSSSRSGLLTAGVVLAAGAVLAVLARRGWRRAVQLVALGLTACLAAVGAVLPFLPWPPEAFTERALIWQGTAGAWLSQDEVFGLGTQWFTEVGGTVTSPLNDAAYHAHNQFLQLGATGGLLLVVLASVWLLAVTLLATDAGSPAQLPAALTVLAVVVSGYLEVPVGFVDRWAFWVVTSVPLAAAYFSAPRVFRWGGEG